MREMRGDGDCKASLRIEILEDSMIVQFCRLRLEGEGVGIFNNIIRGGHIRTCELEYDLVLTFMHVTTDFAGYISRYTKSVVILSVLAK